MMSLIYPTRCPTDTTTLASMEGKFGSSHGSKADLRRDNICPRGCVRRARMLFNSPDLNLKSAALGSFTLTPGRGILTHPARGCAAAAGMIFGEAPPFRGILERVSDFEAKVICMTPE